MYRIKLNKNINQNVPAIATIGNFDGLHLGHMQLFNALGKIAAPANYRKVVITFEPLPLEYFSDLQNLPRLNRLSLIRDKFNILNQQNLADELVILHFKQNIANLTPKDFILSILKQMLQIEYVVIGHDFKFGKDASGTVDHFLQHGIQICDVPPFYLDNQRVSSSLIRSLASQNDLENVRRFLGRNITYTSRVIYGNQLGRKFNVPTINLFLGRNYPALWGIYLAYVYIDGIRYNAVASIGKNPTVSRQDTYKLEAHLLGVDLNLYGKIATIEILHFMRHELKFKDLDSLFKQIYTDLELARNYFDGLVNNGL